MPHGAFGRRCGARVADSKAHGAAPGAGHGRRASRRAFGLFPSAANRLDLGLKKDFSFGLKLIESGNDAPRVLRMCLQHAQLPNSGAFSWIVEGGIPTSSAYKFVIKSSSDPSNFAISSGCFSVDGECLCLIILYIYLIMII